jgi:hypothetical protein
MRLFIEMVSDTAALLGILTNSRIYVETLRALQIQNCTSSPLCRFTVPENV